MLVSLALALRQLPDSRFLRVLGGSLLATLLLFVAAGWGLEELLRGVDPCAIVSTRSCPLGTGGGGLAALLATLLGLWLLFPAIAIGVMQVFADRIVEAVEARHYPAAFAKARPVSWATAIRLGLGSAGRVIGYNLLALPFYLLLLVTGVGALALFLAVNALVMGRDLGEMVAARHLDAEGRRAWLKASRGDRALLGLAVTGLFMVPGLNLLAPILGASAATHRFHRRRT